MLMVGLDRLVGSIASPNNSSQVLAAAAATKRPLCCCHISQIVHEVEGMDPGSTW